MLVLAYLLLAAGLLRSLYGLDQRTRRWQGGGCLLALVALLGLLFARRAELIPGLLVGAALLYAMGRYQLRSVLIRALGDAFLILLALVLGMHLLPGLGGLPLSHSVPAGALAAPQFAQFDKAFAGILLLAVAPSSRLRDWRGALIIPAGIAVVIAIGIGAGLEWRPSWPKDAWWLLGVNLISTVIAEEALFRGLIQHHAARRFASLPHGAWLALALASMLFGLAHWGGGPSLVILASLAGIVYGLVYQVSGKLSAAVAAHLGLNGAAFFLLAN